MLRLTLATLVSLAIVACRDAPPNLVLITLDHTRAGDFGIYDNEGARTANFDRFARNAVLYERAYSTSSDSLSSHASLLTGLYPMQHGARARLVANSTSSPMQPLSDRATTLAEALRGRGYATAAVVANPKLRRELGLAQGFEHFDDTLAQSGPDAEARRPERVVDLAMDRLATFGEEPFLLFVDLFDSRDLDDARVAALDIQLGRLLTALAAAARGKETLIAITADSGGTRDDASRAPQLYEEAVRVPLALRYPVGASAPAGLEPGTRVDTATQNHRLFATFLEAAGIALPKQVGLHPFGGRDSLIFTELRQPASGKIQGAGPARDLRAIYLFPFKLIQTASGHSEFYNLDKDPSETHSDAIEMRKAYSRLLKMLIQFTEAHPPLFHGRDEHRSNVWPASVAKLDALGTVE
jgi:arylsulfatase A-like enzyme